MTPLKSALQRVADILGIRRSSGRLTTLRLPNGQLVDFALPKNSEDAYRDGVLKKYVFDPTWALAMKLGARGRTCFDLGANIGVYSLPWAKAGADVHAFELLQQNVECLQRASHAARLSNLAIIHAAVGRASGRTGASGESAWGVVDPAGTDVRQISIDDYVDEHAIGRIDVVKIDIEGSEREALAGLSRTLTRFHPDVIIECNVLTCGNNGYSYRELLAHLESSGYSIYRILEARLCPWGAARVQENIVVDYYATTKPPDEISRTTGFPIAPLSNEEIEQSIVSQQQYGDTHILYVLAVQNHVQMTDDLAKRIAAWPVTHSSGVERILRIGAGLSPEGLAQS
jgi:FkbM family methyltransferase